MKSARSFFLVVTALALFISACSQPEDLQTPNVKPQFGTADRDAESSVALAPGGGSYVLSEQSGVDASDDSYYFKIILRHYSSSGTLLWTKDVAFLEESLSVDYYPQLFTGTVERDASGRAYVLFGQGAVFQDYADGLTHRVAIYGANAQLERSFPVGQTLWPLGEPDRIPYIAVDASGNTYIAIQQATVADDGFNFSTENLIRKYSPTGTLLWERTLNIGVPNGVAVVENGSVYVAGPSGLARYGSGGKMLWKKPGFYTGVATSGSSIYTHNKNKVFAFNSTGQTRWTRVIGGLNEAHIQDLGGDTNGNVFVSGKYLAGSGNRNAFVRKFRAAGSSQWTKVFGTSVYDDATGVAALGNGLSYVTGVTLGSLAHPNRGEEDGYLRKLNISGNPLWTR